MSPLSEEDIKRLDDRYVTKVECEIKTDKTQEDIASMKSDMASMCVKQDITNKWLGVIGGAIITGLVGLVVAFIKYVVIGG